MKAFVFIALMLFLINGSQSSGKYIKFLMFVNVDLRVLLKASKIQ